jgi:sugar/nucleoside kinase (ribokinase family)
MPLLVVGSVALDTVETPVETRRNVLGGSAVFFAYSASFFGPSWLCAPVGEDWPDEHTQLLRDRDVDTAGLEVVPGGKTFRWRGKYAPNMNDRETLEVHLNVIEQFDPVLPDPYRNCRFLFLGNVSPTIQHRVLDQVDRPVLTIADTMDLWINIQHDELLSLLKRVDGLLLNDSEARMLADDENTVRAGRKIREMGPRFVIVKKGEHGALFIGQDQMFVLPAFPTERIVDPTGAGDSFAGGLMGYLASADRLDEATFRQALAYGAVVASFSVEDFSLDRLRTIDRTHIEARMAQYREMLAF